jgi:hypothetical protein
MTGIIATSADWSYARKAVAEKGTFVERDAHSSDAIGSMLRNIESVVAFAHAAGRHAAYQEMLETLTQRITSKG